MRSEMPDSDYPDIRNLHLFRDMSDTHFSSLMRGAYVQSFPARTSLITEGAPSEFLHVVLSGAVDLYSGWNNRESSMATIRPVETFILSATICDGPYLLSARTLEDCKIALIPSHDVRAIFEIDHDFARTVVTSLALDFRAVIKVHKDIKLRTSNERLANYLLRQQRLAGGAAEFDLRFEKRRLASLLGMAPEHLSRAFRRLNAHGVVVNGSHITIEDRKSLERFANPCPFIDDHTV